MHTCCKLIVSVVLLLLMTAVSAMRISSLYEASVPVVSQQPDVRRIALQTALWQVLLRVSGERQLAERPLLKAAAKNAEAFVDEFRYVTMTPEGASQPSLFLRANFDPSSINALLRQAGAPVWGANRPLILVYLAGALPAGGLHIMTADQGEVAPLILKKIAAQRGVPIIFPLMDLAELKQVTATDVVQEKFSVLALGADRYKSEGIVAGAVMQDATGWHMVGSLQLGVTRTHFDVTGKDESAVLTDFMHQLADTLAARYAVVASPSHVAQTMRLTVTGIHGANDVTALTQYLEGLSSVAGIEIVQVLDDSVVLAVTLRGTSDAFAAAISVDHRLEPVSEAIYQWKG